MKYSVNHLHEHLHSPACTMKYFLTKLYNVSLRACLLLIIFNVGDLGKNKIFIGHAHYIIKGKIMIIFNYVIGIVYFYSHAFDSSEN